MISTSISRSIPCMWSGSWTDSRCDQLRRLMDFFEDLCWKSTLIIRRSALTLSPTVTRRTLSYGSVSPRASVKSILMKKPSEPVSKRDCMISLLSAPNTNTCLAPSSAVSPLQRRQGLYLPVPAGQPLLQVLDLWIYLMGSQQLVPEMLCRALRAQSGHGDYTCATPYRPSALSTAGL
ncbi:hypothetical protein T10_8670 [Trichinella papuae]|uniref:Uncharacterized protein n=1 Tax=Trichinella papuae TaxID=268474 RepID=A0A0V1N799_9BILA|nr:hypothetical protein T10_8670 [Trichinella papuae]